MGGLALLVVSVVSDVDGGLGVDLLSFWDDGRLVKLVLVVVGKLSWVRCS